MLLIIMSPSSIVLFEQVSLIYFGDDLVVILLDLIDRVTKTSNKKINLVHIII